MSTGRSTITPCGLAGVTAVQADSHHIFPRHFHDQFGIGTVERGAQKSLSGRGIVEAIAGDTITVNPGEVHDGAPIGEGGRAWTMLYLDSLLVAKISADFSEGGKGDYEFILPVIHHPETSRRFRRLFHAVTAQNVEAPILLREESLFILFSNLMIKPAPTRRRVSPPIRQARELIDTQSSTLITLDDLARESGLSRFQVIRGFAKETGLTPHAYLIQRRLHQARNMIIHGMPLVEISAVCGFADQSHMNRLFLRVFGVTPGAYAKAVA